MDDGRASELTTSLRYDQMNSTLVALEGNAQAELSSHISVRLVLSKSVDV